MKAINIRIKTCFNNNIEIFHILTKQERSYCTNDVETIKVCNDIARKYGNKTGRKYSFSWSEISIDELINNTNIEINDIKKQIDELLIILGDKLALLEKL